MDLHDLQDVLRERADGGSINGPDLDLLLGKGKARHRRRQLATAASAPPS